MDIILQKSFWFWVMDANRGYIFLSSNYQDPECWKAGLELFTRATLMAGSPKIRYGCTAKGEGENYSAPIRKNFLKTLLMLLT